LTVQASAQSLARSGSLRERASLGSRVARRRFGTPAPERQSPSSTSLRFRRVANIKSQIKRIRTNEKARLRNKAVKSSLKTAVRRFREAAAAGDRETATAELQVASRQLDKAVSKGVIHANQAANKKSAMAKAAAKL
jgi:small subunit ribosomal protein S20